MLNGKATIVLSIVVLIKKRQIESTEYFSKSKSLGANIKIKLDFSNHATKVDLKNATGVDLIYFAKKADLVNLKSDVDELYNIDKLKNEPSGLNSLKSKVNKLDTWKLETTPVDLSKLSNVVKKQCCYKRCI